jgi:mono/diheme cytochrome c family protein
MNNVPSQEWLNALLLMVQSAELVLLRLVHALGLSGNSHGQMAWPWAHRIAGETLLMDLGLARQLVWSIAAMGFVILALVLAITWRRRRLVWIACMFLALLCIPWPSIGLVFGPAVPTSFHVSSTHFSVASITQGAHVYALHCAGCHGADGRGEGPLAATLVRWPPTFASPLLARRADGEMFWRIQHGMRDEQGHATMPAFSAQLNDADTWAVLDYIKALAAGTSASVTGNWSLPVLLPDVEVRCGEDAPRPLARWRTGQRVRIIAFDGDAASIPVDDGRLMTLLVTRDGKAPAHMPQFRSDCTAASTQAWDVFAWLAGVPDNALGGTQLLADRAGWLRARSNGKIVWSDADLLCKSGPTGAASSGTAADGLTAILNRMDAEPVRLVKGGYVH